jgi:hypothetical protein
MATAVQIELRVDENGAVTGLRAFDSEIKRTTNNIRVMGEEGNRAGKKVRGGMQDADKAVLTTKDNAKLLTQEFGIHMPKAMLKVIAHSELLGGAINAVSSGLIALGAAGIIVNMAREVYDLYEKWLDVGSAAREYQEELKKQKAEAFIDVHSIETARDRIREAKDEAKSFGDASKALQSAGFAQFIGGLGSGNASLAGAGFGTLLSAKKLADTGVESQKQADKISDKYGALQHKQALAEIELVHSSDGRLRNEAKITAEFNKQLAINAENAKFSRYLDSLRGNKTPSDAASTEQRTADQLALAKAGTDLFNLRREQTNAIVRMQNDAVNAGLRGELLALAQRRQAYDEFVRQYGSSTAARKAIDDRYFNDLARRVEEYERQGRKAQQDSAAAGLTGISAVQARGAARVADINEAFKTAGYENIDRSDARGQEAYARAVTERDHQIATAQQQTLQEMQREQETFHKQIDDLSEQSTMRQVSGFAKIYAEGDKALRDLQRRFDETYGKMRLDNPEAVKVFQQGQADLARAKSGVAADTNSQVQDLAQKNANETLRIETEAQQKVQALHHDQTSALYSEYNARVAAYDEMLRKQEISQDDYNRRVAAAGRELNAELAQQAKETRDKLAGELEQFFDNPQQFFQRAAKRAMAESAATILLQLRSKIAGQGPGQGSGDRPWSELPTDRYGVPDILGGLFHRNKQTASAFLFQVRISVPAYPACSLPARESSRSRPLRSRSDRRIC